MLFLVVCKLHKVEAVDDAVILVNEVDVLQFCINCSRVFFAFEENRPNSNNYSLLHQMMASISQMEEVAKMQVSSSFEIDDMETVVSELDRDFAMQADVPTDSELDGSLLYQGDMPEPHEQLSPESIAGWMIRRLSRRIYSAVVSGSKVLRRYYVMREINAWNSACVSTF